MIQIIDNVVSSRYQNDLEETFFSKDFPWCLNDSITGTDDSNHFGLAHSIIKAREIRSHKLDYVLPLVFEIADKSNSDVSKIYAARAFMQVPRNCDDQHDHFHVDVLQNHIVFLYYLNDSDGDTIILNKKCTDSNQAFYGGEYTESDVLERVTPKKGRVVVFDGMHYHAAGIPKENYRAVLNFDMVKE